MTEEQKARVFQAALNAAHYQCGSVGGVKLGPVEAAEQIVKAAIRASELINRQCGEQAPQSET